MSDTERGYVPHNPNGRTDNFDSLQTGERECPDRRCEETRYTTLGMEFHLIRDHDEER